MKDNNNLIKRKKELIKDIRMAEETRNEYLVDFYKRQLRNVKDILNKRTKNRMKNEKQFKKAN